MSKIFWEKHIRVLSTDNVISNEMFFEKIGQKHDQFQRLIHFFLFITNISLFLQEHRRSNYHNQRSNFNISQINIVKNAHDYH